MMPRYDLDYDPRYDRGRRRPPRRFRGGGRRRERFRAGERGPFERDPFERERFGREPFEREPRRSEPPPRGYRSEGAWNEPEYDREYTGYGVGRVPEDEAWGYGREYGKTEWETDYGDPFRDRERGTPIRMIEGGWGGYGREYYGRERGMGRPRGRRRGRGYDEYEREYRPWRERRY